jgi:hypothetical protein
MAAFKFKVCLEDNEDVFRDIEIKSIQNFEEFHNTIQEAFKFDNKHAASFFVSDDYWRKGQEITLRKEDLPLDEEEVRKKVSPKKLMSEVKIAKYIEQPHQRFLYVFDVSAQWTFLVEMIKIVADNAKLTYPAIVKSVGTAPKQYKQIKLIKDELPAGEAGLAALLADIDEPDDDEILNTIVETQEAIEDDDLEHLEGEEGEDEDLENAEDADEFGHSGHDGLDEDER